MNDVQEPGTQRVLVLWIPDWPVRAHQLEATEHAQPPRSNVRQPVALIEKHRVTACSPEARTEGVRIGIRLREAQLRCPTLITYPHDPTIDARRFAPICAAIEQSVPDIEPIRPGLIAVRVRGPARYYGGEAAAATVLHRIVTELGFPETRIGIADGRFAAEQAARAHSSDTEVMEPGPGVRIVQAAATARFLSPLPISRATESELAATLQGLGIRTLGAFAALPDHSVRERFGVSGTLAHRLAAGYGSDRSDEVRPRTPPRELAVQLDLEPPAAGADHLAFACSTLTDRFAAALREEQLVCTEVSIELTDDAGIRHERSWAHPRHFTGPELVGRLRWQTEALPQHEGEGQGGIARVRITPLRTDRAASHEPGLWNTGPDERVHHHLSRAQGVLGHEAVGTAELTGGRLLAERWHHVPWSTRLPEKQGRSSPQGPWPGSMTGPLPTVVFPEPVPVTLLDANDTPVTIDSDDLLSAHPARLHASLRSMNSEVVDTAASAWSRPWPLRERWWRGCSERFRLQLLLTDGDAWLLLYQSGTWAAEGRYL